MREELDYILDGIRFSYSSTNTFTTCPYSFKLTYIDSLKPRMPNFYSEFGLLVHDCLAKYFTNELDIYELSEYYRDNFLTTVITSPPDFQGDLLEKYRKQGHDFFHSFSFEKDSYDVLLVEDTINFDLDGEMFVAKPDLVLQEKGSKKTILFDYKTATPFWESKKTGEKKSDNKKIDGYNKQMYLYTYALRTVREIQTDEVTLWFVRLGEFLTTPWNPMEEEKAVQEIRSIVTKLRQEENFPYDNTNTYFCDNLCGVRKFCEYR